MFVNNCLSLWCMRLLGCAGDQHNAESVVRLDVLPSLREEEEKTQHSAALPLHGLDRADDMYADDQMTYNSTLTNKPGHEQQSEQVRRKLAS